MGGPLFNRGTRRIELTPAGEVLFAEVGRVLAAARDARHAVTQGSRARTRPAEYRCDARPRAFRKVNDMPMLLELAAQGLVISMVPESVATARGIDTRGAPVSTARLREGEEPCWELAGVFKGSAEEPLIPFARAFLDLLKLPVVTT